ncbi:MAG: hypothetical protein E1N59_1367 [Puniceicoccaceae bacterium 5H]|nr:MAG: hypothetical protein E1N59_1367 [Puniceicoccaceae bacterium 5H]
MSKQWVSRIFWALLAAALIGLGVYLWQHHNLTEQDVQEWARSAHPLWVIGMILVLPMFGFPISITLFITGVRFGFGWGMAIVTLVVLLQLLAALPLGRGPLNRVAHKCFGDRVHALRNASTRSQAVITFFTTLIPGPPYIGKIYGLAAAHVPPSIYLGIGWPIFVITAVPLVGLGGAAFNVNADRILLFVALAALLALGLHWVRKRWGGKAVANAS